MSNSDNETRHGCPYPECKVLDERTRAMTEKLDDIHKAIMGNGEPEQGLVSTVANLKGHVKAMWPLILLCLSGLGGVTSLIIMIIKG